MCERAERDEGETVVEGLPKSTLHELSRTMSFVPAGHRYSGWQKPRALARVTYFYIDPSGPLIDPELHFAEAEFKPRLYFFDKDLWETAQKLKAQAGHCGPADRQYAEALSIVLAHELLRVNNGGVTATHRIRGGLAGWQEKRVAQFIEEHLAEDPSLATLADVARLSPYHFVRAFKQSFGLPPHRYMSRLRVEQAKALLANPATSVTIQSGLQRNQLVHDDVPQAYRAHADGVPARPRLSRSRAEPSQGQERSCRLRARSVVDAHGTSFGGYLD
jgi:AraC family transcriptional regulator